MYLEEEQKEQIINENETKEEENLPQDNEEKKNKLIDLKQPNEKPYVEMVEEMRLTIFNDVKKAQKRSRISSAIMMLCLFAAVIFLFARNESNSTAFLTIGISLLVLAILVLIVTAVINKRTKRIDTKGDYITPACAAINRHVFDDGRFKEMTFDPDEKVDLGDIYGDAVYSGVTDSVSRSVVHGKYNGRDFMVGDLGLYVGPKGRGRRTTFIGKYIRTNNSLHFSGQYIIISKAENEMDIPTLPEGMELLSEDNRFLIYGNAGAPYQKDITSEFISKIKKIDVSGVLLNICIGLKAQETCVYLSFDDPVTTLPFYESLQDSAIDEYKRILMEVMEALDILSK